MELMAYDFFISLFVTFLLADILTTFWLVLFELEILFLNFIGFVHVSLKVLIAEMKRKLIEV